MDKAVPYEMQRVGRSDIEVIQQAYEAEVANLFATLVDNMIGGDTEPDKKFKRGLTIIKQALVRACQLVNENC